MGLLPSAGQRSRLDSIQRCANGSAVIRIATVLLFLFANIAFANANWRSELSPPAPGNFPPPPSLTASYDLGWLAFTGAHADITFSRPQKSTLELKAHGGTIGLVRRLWKLDADYVARANAKTLLPIDLKQTERYSGYTIRTTLKFTNREVWQLRSSTRDQKPAKWKHVKFPDLRGLFSALLYIRSQPLAKGQTWSLVVYPQSTAYLAQVKILGKEKIQLAGKTYPAFKMDLKLKKITKKFELEPHKKFKSATAWISDDANRIPLKIEADVFVGSVWAELRKVQWKQ